MTAERICRDARGCDGGVRQELATGIGPAPPLAWSLVRLAGAMGSGDAPAGFHRRTAAEQFATILLPNSVAQRETEQHTAD
jgi:hypothetical protein